MKRFLLNQVLPYLVYAVLHLWCRTLRVHNLNPEGENFFLNQPGKFILSLWHGRIFYLFYRLRNHPELNLLISPSQDGDFLARLARLMGYTVIRGSSFKRAVPSARSLIKVLRRNETIVVVADGSRGPRCKAQPGALQLAGITGAPVIPMTFDAKRKWVLSSWDRFIIPLPFTRCVVHFGNPICVPSRPDEETLRKKQKALEDSLNQITLACEKYSD